jgi:hypothetical protein
MYITWYGIYRVIIAGLVLYILKLRANAKTEQRHFISEQNKKNSEITSLKKVTPDIPTSPVAAPSVPPVVIITIEWGGKRAYLFDVLTTVGLTCDTKQRAGIEDLVMKDKEELGFHVEGGDDDVPGRT